MYFDNVFFKKIKVLLSALVLVGASMIFMSCSNGGDDTTTVTGDWVRQASIDAGRRSRPVLFTIGDSLYIATGFNGTSGKVFYNDLWVYDASSLTWKKRPDIQEDVTIAAPRSGAVAFSVNGKGYVGLGYDGTNYLKDFWSYEPVAGVWTKVADFPGDARDGAIAFCIDNKCYVGTGHSSTLDYKDFWQYNDVDNVWVSKPSVPKIERANAFSFVIDGKAYVGGGANNGTLVQDLYEYDPIGGANGTGAWTEKNDLQDDKNDTDANDKGYTIAREMAATFVISGKGYVATGKRLGQYNSQCWEYNPSTDTWKQMTAFEGTGRYGAVGFTMGNLGYIGAGLGGEYLNDLWSLDPTKVSN
jgi:N-acetylneuraminic acid mutarotase